MHNCLSNSKSSPIRAKQEGGLNYHTSGFFGGGVYTPAGGHNWALYLDEQLVGVERMGRMIIKIEGLPPNAQYEEGAECHWRVDSAENPLP
jgi:hypothetical protein